MGLFDGFGAAGILGMLTGQGPAGPTADTLGGGAKVFGTKPRTAPFVPTDLTAEEQKSLAGNLSNADQIEALLNRLVPGWSESLKTGTANATALLHGQLPQDVQDQIYRNSAYKALSGGYGGSGMAHALTLRDFGLNSLQAQQQGQNAAQSWAQAAEKAYSPWLSSGAEQAGATRANNAGLQAQQQQEFNVAAAPDPAAASEFAINSAVGMQLLNLGLGAAGGAIGGAGGAAAGAGAGGGGLYNYAGTSAGGTPWQYNSSTGQYAPILQAQPSFSGAYGRLG